MTRLSEDDADASKHVGLLTICKIMLIYIIYVVHLLVWIINRTIYTVHTSNYWNRLLVLCVTVLYYSGTMC